MTHSKMIIFLVVILLLPALTLAGTGLPYASPVVTGADIAVTDTAYGKVRGYIRNGTYVYKGIPYARAERFMPPEKPLAWEGIRSSMAWGPVCPQMLDLSPGVDEVDFMLPQNQGVEAENCQVLNIWTQGVGAAQKRPVMVWLHGGGFAFGSSQGLDMYDGESLSKNGDVVMVSVNHRLNVLGFADLSDFGEQFKFSANAGMMDLVAVLEWIQENIANFGGDPGNVTLFGQSGGGAKVGTLMCAPSAEGLFHKAIIQSGGDPQFQDPALTKRIGRELVRELGLKKNKINAIKTIPHARVIEAGRRAMDTVRKELTREGNPPLGFGFGFSPCRDGRFLPYDARDSRAFALSTDIPLLIGSTKTEFLKSMWGDSRVAGAGPEAVAAYIRQQYGEKAEAFTAAVKKAFPGDDDPCLPVDVDTRFRRSAVVHADLKSKNGQAPVFVYLFTWNSPVLDGQYKSLHSMDLPFVFNNIDLAETMTGGGAAAHILANTISRSWIGFARNGNPNHDGIPHWPAYTGKNGHTMFLDNVCTVRSHHDRELLQVTSDEPPLW